MKSILPENRRQSRLLLAQPVPAISAAVIPSYDYKYVIIPGTAAARTASAVDLNDYAAIAKYYHLKE